MAIKLTKKYLIILSISLLLCLIILLFNQKNVEYITSSTNNIKILANGVEVDTFPIKSEGYVYDGIECINGTTGVWNEDTWSLKIDTNKADGCIIYFYTPYKEELLKGSDPVLTQGLVPVEIDSDGTVKKADIQTSWYSYKDSEWANAVTVNDESIRNSTSGTIIQMDNIVQMYVWIPRYEYKKSSIVDASQDIEINFVGLDKTSTSEQVENDDIIVHPAFCWGNYCQDDRENPENMELPGLWVGKFEQGTDNTIKPNQNSMNNLNVSTLYDKVNDMNNENGLNTTSDIHMIKNIDWGAIAYLSQSMYGICNDDGTCTDTNGNNIKIENNNYSLATSMNIITGCGGNDTSVIGTCPDTNRWQTSNGMKASTTHNITGIYDMAGGRDEYLMGNMKYSNGNYYINSSGFILETKPEQKYYNIYEYNDDKNDFSGYIIGDATMQSTFREDGRMIDWNDDASYFVNNTNSYFVRGGRAAHNSGAGIWFFSYRNGNGLNDSTPVREYISTRSILTPLTTYTVTIEQNSNGNIEEIYSAVAGSTVKLNVTPNEGYLLKGFEIVNSSTKEVYKTYTNYEKEFIMPEFNVTIRPIYIEGYEFAYTGTSQEFIVPSAGNYKVELWGASGGIIGSQSINSAYVSGIININNGETLFVLVGEKGKDSVNTTRMPNPGGYNGGGIGGSSNHTYVTYIGGSGGGSTDIRISENINSRIIVAGASGGAGYSTNSIDAAKAGGLIGYSAGTSSGSQENTVGNTGATQISSGGNRIPTSTSTHCYSSSGNFGIGGNAITCVNPGAGGGGGYYGGSSGIGGMVGRGGTYGSGGSSFISGHTGAVAITSETDRTPKSGCTTGTTDNACSIHYSGMVFTDTVMIDGAGYAWTNVKGELEQMPNPSGGLYELGEGHNGNGYARITKID